MDCRKQRFGLRLRNGLLFLLWVFKISPPKVGNAREESEGADAGLRKSESDPLRGL